MENIIIQKPMSLKDIENSISIMEKEKTLVSIRTCVSAISTGVTNEIISPSVGIHFTTSAISVLKEICPVNDALEFGETINFIYDKVHEMDTLSDNIQTRNREIVLGIIEKINSMLTKTENGLIAKSEGCNNCKMLIDQLNSTLHNIDMIKDVESIMCMMDSINERMNKLL